jgi:hypothetical protein
MRMGGIYGIAATIARRKVQARHARENEWTKAMIRIGIIAIANVRRLVHCRAR